MKLDNFRRLLKREINNWDIDGRYTLYKEHYTVWDKETDLEYKHKTLDDALQFEIEGVKLITLLENLPEDHFKIMTLNGGSGASSGERMRVGDVEKGVTGGKTLYPSIRNSSTDKSVGGGRYKTTADAVKDFDNAHRNSNIEYSVTIDEAGYTHAYHSGDSGATAFTPKNNMHVVHNHPTRPDGLAGGNMSTQDLKAFSSTKIKSMSAIDRDGNYSIRKGAKFDSKGFNQAIARVEKRGLGVQGIKADNWVDRYSKGMSKWLKINSKRYGYEYSFTPHSN